MTPLHQRHCRPATGPALSAAGCQPLLAELPGWTLADGALQRVFSFDSYGRMMGFVAALAWLAEREDHHPDLHITWGRCTVRWHTHSVGGLSINDFICAAQVDALRP